jgi:hypothetical protein
MYVVPRHESPCDRRTDRTDQFPVSHRPRETGAAEVSHGLALRKGYTYHLVLRHGTQFPCLFAMDTVTDP